MLELLFEQVWRPQLGAVDLSLKVGGTTLDLVVTPLQATLLLQFKVHCAASRSPTRSMLGAADNGGTLYWNLISW